MAPSYASNAPFAIGIQGAILARHHFAARAAGRFELRGGIQEFAAAAAGAVAPGGKVVLLMDGQYRSETRAMQALADSGLFTCKVIVVRPSPGRNPIYRIFEASRQSGSRTEISLCMRIAEAGEFSPEYEAIRREMDFCNKRQLCKKARFITTV